MIHNRNSKGTISYMWRFANEKPTAQDMISIANKTNGYTKDRNKAYTTKGKTQTGRKETKSRPNEKGRERENGIKGGK